MPSAGSDEHYLQCKNTAISLNLIINFYHLVFESYARSPRNDLMMLPKEPGDFRERVERETIRG